MIIGMKDFQKSKRAGVLAVASAVVYFLLIVVAAVADPDTWTKTFNPAADANGSYGAFNWQWSGVNDQSIVATITNTSIAGWTPVFRLSKEKLSGIVLQSTGTVSATSNALYSLVNSNIPPVGFYYGELAAVSGSVYKVLAQGKVNVYASLFGTTNWAEFTPRVDTTEVDPVWTAEKSGYATTATLASTGAAITVEVSNHNASTSAHTGIVAGLVPTSHLADATAHASLMGTLIPTSQLGVANGVATLDEDGYVAQWVPYALTAGDAGTLEGSYKAEFAGTNDLAVGLREKLPGPGSNDVIVVIGDSLSAPGPNQWPNVLAARYPSATWANTATGGLSLATISTNINAHLDPYFNSNKTCRAILFSAQVNDVSTWQDFATAYTNLAAVIVAKGWKLSCVEMYGWGASPLTNTTPRVQRKIRESANSIGYVFISGVAEAINGSGGYIKAAYNTGDGHLNAAGQLVVADIIDKRLRSGDKYSDGVAAFFSNGKTVITGPATRIPSGALSIEHGDVDGTAYAPIEVAQWATMRANGYIGRRATARVVGSDGTNSYVVYTNAYADVAMVETNQLCEIASGAHAGVYKITAVGSVISTNAPLVGALPGDTLVTLGGVANTNAIANGIVVNQGRVIGKVIANASLQFGALEVDYASVTSGGAGDAGKWLTTIYRGAGSISSQSPVYANRYFTSGTLLNIATHVSATTNLYIAVMGGSTSQSIGYQSKYPVALGKLTKFGTLELRSATAVEE